MLDRPFIIHWPQLDKKEKEREAILLGNVKEAVTKNFPERLLQLAIQDYSEQHKKNRRIPRSRDRKTFAVSFFNDTILISSARCSKRDQFSRRIGAEVTRGRLEKYLDFYSGQPPKNINDPNLSEHVCTTTLEELLDVSKLRLECSIPSDVVQYIAKLYIQWQAVQDEAKPF